MVEQASVVVCLPTYNEARNLRPAVAALRRHLPAARLLVIDDASPDGTGEVADELAREDPLVAVLHRPRKQGLGPAYLHGFATAMQNPDVEVVGQMDADLSHDPTYLPAMLRALERADVVIGSRYVPGGGTRDWGLHRRLLSRCGGAYARWWLGLPVRDPTSGFRLWRRGMLTRVMEYGIETRGYAFQVELAYLAHLEGARIEEVPIVFTDRRLQASKMNLAIAWEAAWRVPRMRLRRRRPGRGAPGEGP